MRQKTFLSFLACLVLVLSEGLAQTTSGSIAGNVTDPSGAAIGSASVVLRDQNRDSLSNTVTDAQGRFVFPTVPPGQYTIIVEQQGFKKLERRDVNQLANQNQTLGTLTLQVGAVSESIEVTAQGEQLQTESGERSASLTGKQVTNIALNSRSYLPLVALVPGVTTAPSLQTAGHSGVGSISVNGARSNQNNLTLDGVGNVDTGNNGDQLATLSLDSVQEFRILTSNYQAEYGRSSGSQISVVTKSGTSSFHGSGFLFHRHEGLNANNWYNNREGQKRNRFRYNDTGYTLGGPVIVPGFREKLKNRIFFFSSEEWQNQLQPQGLRQRTVPTALERLGDFSQSVDKNGKPFPYIKDPNSNLPCSQSNTGGCFAAGGVLGRIPASSLYGPGLAVLNAYPLPNAQSPSNIGFNYQSAISGSYPRREDLGRIDLNLNDKNKLFVRFVNNFDAVSSPYGSFVLGSDLPKAVITDARPGKAWATSWTWNVNPTTVNEATWGFGKNVINISPTTNALTRTANGLTGLPVLYPNAVQNDFIPNFVFAGTRLANTADNAFGTNNAPFFNYNTTIEWIDNFSKVINQHTLKLGFYAQRSRKDQTSFANANGHYDFSDNSANPFDTGFGYANASVGVYNTFDQASAYLRGKYRYTNVEWYVQDTWKLTRSFTLDYGLRFYYIQPQFDSALQTSTWLPDRYNRAAAPRLYQPVRINGTRYGQDPANPSVLLPSYAVGNIVPNSGNLLNGIARAAIDINKYLMKSPGILYAPRLGFAWDITGKQRFVLRGGGGIFYDRYQGNNIFDEITNPPSTFDPTLTYGFVSGINPANALLAPSNLLILDGHGKIPTTGNFSLGLQTKLPFQIILDTSYVGARSWHQLDKRNLNAIQYNVAFLPSSVDPTATLTIPGSNALPRNFLRPYPGFGDISIHEYASTSNYNSLQVSANRQFARGLFLGLAYTYGKALGVTSGDGDFIRIDNLNRFANYGPLNFDRRHTLAINYIYNIPSLFKSSGVLHTIVDGWQISGLTRLQTGSPYEVRFSVPGYNNQNYTGSYTEGPRVQVIGDPLKGAKDTGPYNRLNPNAFAPPTATGVGASLGEGRNPFYGPGINNTDLSLQKTFAFGERFQIQLRGDAFNVANHAQFGGVGGSGVVNNSGINSTLNFSGLNNPTVTNAYDPFRNRTGFGSVQGARDPRIMQLGARIVF